MFVGPSGALAPGPWMTRCIRANKVPRINWCAVMTRIAVQLSRVDGLNASIDAGWRPAIQFSFVEIDSFVELGRRSRRRGVRGAPCHTGARDTIPRLNHRRIEETIIGDVIEHALGARTPAGDERGQAGKRIRRFRG